MKHHHFVFETTAACNADCIFCYNIWKESGATKPKQLSLKEIKTLFSKLMSDTLIGGVTLAGGEPLLRKDLTDVVSHLTTLGIPTGIATNGTLLNKLQIEILRTAGAQYFDISLPATDSREYKALTNQDECSSVRTALLELNSAGIPFTVSTILTAKNFTKVAEVIQLAAAFGANAVSLNRFVPGGNGLSNFTSLALSTDQLFTALDKAAKTYAKTLIPIAATIPVEPCLLPHNRWAPIEFTACRCGEEKWVISPDGKLRTCEQNPQSLGSLLEFPFSKLSQKPEVTEFRKNGFLKTECTTCSSKHACGGGCRFLQNRTN